jgi:hypothetical protein
MSVRTLDWAHGRLEVQTLGAMAGPIRFRLGDGRTVEPMQVAPWAEEPGAADLPGILRRLRGEWPCVPFGIAREVALAGAWADLVPDLAAGPAEPHGACSNADWTWEDAGDDATLALSFSPPSGPVRRITRRIRPDADAPAVDFELVVEAAEPCRLPIGVHPVFRIPEGGAVLSVPGADGGMVFPAEVEPGVSRLAPGAAFADLAAVPATGGRTCDLTRLPLPWPTEELVQLAVASGRAELRHVDDGVTVTLDWDATHFPSLVLWFSNRGRTAWPWSGRHMAIGIEPVAAAFDLGTAISAGANPLGARGVATAVELHPGRPFRTRYRIGVQS